MTDIYENPSEDYGPSEIPEGHKPLISNAMYEGLRSFVQVVLPGLGVLYGSLGAAWGWPATEQVVVTIAAVTLFLGLVVGWLRRLYNKSDDKYDGVIQVHTDDNGMKQADLVLKNYENPAEVVEQKEVLFKVEGQ